MIRPKQVAAEGDEGDVLTQVGGQIVLAAPTGGGGSGGGGGTSTTNLYTPPTTPHAKDDEFADGSGQSGPVNGLDAKWTRHNLAGAMVNLTDLDNFLIFNVTGSQPVDQAITQPIPSGDFHATACAVGLNVPGRQMWGLFVANGSGNGYVVETDNGDTDYVRNLASWVEGSPTGSGSVSNVDGTFFGGGRVVFEIQRVGTTYTFSMTSSDFLPHTYRTKNTITSATAFTVIGFGRISDTSSAATAVGLDFFRVTEP